MHDGDPTAMGEPAGPLAGFRIGVTAYRRAEDLIGAFTRRGATVIHAPVLRLAPVGHDSRLRADTQAIIDARPDVVVVTTAYGVRRWIESADADGVLDDLMNTLKAAQLMVRGPKARGAVRSLGLDDSTAIERALTEDLIQQLVADATPGPGGRGMTVAIQVHGYMDPGQLERLQYAGLRLLTVEPYRWVPGTDLEPVDRLIAEVLAHRLDVLTFTSAPAVDALLGHARQRGQLPELIGCLRLGHVQCAAVGPVTAGPLVDHGIEPLIPDRHRMGALVRTVGDWLIEHRTARVPTSRGTLELRGRCARLDGRPLALSPSAHRMLARLAETPGVIVPRATLLDLLPAGSTSHSVDTTISKLRGALGDSALIRTIVRRGYVLDTAGATDVD